MTLTIQQIIDSIISTIPGAPFAATVDTVKTGDPSREVTGIVTTFLANQVVLEKAIAAGANFVITHEPTFYNHHDRIDWLENHTVYQAKRKLIDNNGLVIWRFHDYWHTHQPDGIMVGMLRALKWDTQVDQEDLSIINLSASTTLRDLVADVKSKLGASHVRVIGAPDLECRRVGLMVGAPPSEWQMELLNADIDVLLAGEINEWETSEYVRDAIAQGRRKALIVLGHAVSEEAGMAYLVEWLRERFPDVPVTHIPTGEPFRVE